MIKQALKSPLEKKQLLDAAIQGSVVGGTIGMGYGAINQHFKNKKLDPNKRKSVLKSSLQYGLGGAVGGGLGTALAEHEWQKENEDFRRRTKRQDHF